VNKTKLLETIKEQYHFHTQVEALYEVMQSKETFNFECLYKTEPENPVKSTVSFYTGFTALESITTRVTLMKWWAQDIIRSCPPLLFFLSKLENIVGPPHTADLDNRGYLSSPPV
jgi:hypothetical protein